MPIPNIPQPMFLPIGEDLRLRRFDGVFSFALPWYQDPETVWLVDGAKTPYTLERLEQMYRWLDARGELYFIELLEDGGWRPIGDVTFWQADMPIVIGEKSCRGRGIGRRVVAALVERGRELGYDHLEVSEIYGYNSGSRRCFESQGFRAGERTERGARYHLNLQGERYEDCI